MICCIYIYIAYIYSVTFVTGAIMIFASVERHNSELYCSVAQKNYESVAVSAPNMDI